MAKINGKRLAGDEALPFIRSFHDIFLCIGILILAIGLLIISIQLIAPYWNSVEDGMGQLTNPLVLIATASLANAAIVWGLAEYFGRIKRRVLPSMLLVLFFILYITTAGLATYGITDPLGVAAVSMDTAEKAVQAKPADEYHNTRLIYYTAITEAIPKFGLAGTITGSLAAMMFYWRTKLPFAMGLFGVNLAGVGIFSTMLILGPEKFTEEAIGFILASGVLMFLLGVYFDARDPDRTTRYADNGFWLHFFAAPVIFVSVMTIVTGDSLFEGEGSAWAITTLATVFVFAFISLLINRRALLVAGLLSAGIAITTLIAQIDLDGVWVAAVTLVLLGGAMLILGAGWYPMRRVLVAPFPKSGPIARIIPPYMVEE